MSDSKYISTIKVEFRDLIANIVTSERKSFHMFTIHRILSLGLLINFTFRHVRTENPEDYVGIELDLEEHGKITFIVSIESGYVHLSTKEDKKTLARFIEEFDTRIKSKSSKVSRVF